MPRRLAPKLILSLTLIVILIGGVSGWINAKTQERYLHETMILGADQLSKSIASATWQAMLDDHREAAYHTMQMIAEKQGVDRIRIFNREGRIMYSTVASEANQRVNQQSATCLPCHRSRPPLANPDIASRTRIARPVTGERVLAMVTPIYNEPSCSEAACHAHPASLRVLGVLDVALKLGPVDREVASVQYAVLVVTGIQVLLISVLIVFFTRHFVGEPIRKLIGATKRVSAMELDRPIDIIQSSEELEEMARAFDGMRERLRLALAEINQFTQNLETKVEERTEQLKAAHQKLMQSDRLASLGQLAASVAHEINNPISGVLNLSMLLQRVLKDDGIPPGRVAEFRKYLAQIANETSRVGRIVSDLLSFSRRSKPQRTEADLNQIIRTTLSLVAHKLKLSGVELEFNGDENLPVVACDASQIQQVVLNLILNAAEATQNKGGGRVWVTTRAASSGQAVILEVRDTGEGIRPEHLKKIFVPFFTTKGDGKGVGLGLAVSYGIVEAHGGEIEVQSKAGEGATFTVTLPLTPPERPPAGELTALEVLRPG